ncbi:tetrapyrrole (Corrin/Porphyrin) Methylases [Geobacter sp. OR-1]|uniref:SAM-dependent methyltransferase n=1 Tax=Geobacter sp. OR-1 TaxID=1266765 RepID=UPI00054432DC|nr:SAM-dependent methyltransferase [Geobacter sp. OR-1]GAM08076.1 tetrapyrrole (Corrin/Porphyrin) Methylases [Geobacter sp. OR-1]
MGIDGQTVSRSGEPRIYLLGSGIFSYYDLTLYTQHLLQECPSVFYLHDLPSLERYIAKLNPKAVNLMPIYYIDGRDRSDIYGDIAAHILRHARENPPVAFLMHGHPLVFSSISQRIILEGEKSGIPVEIVPAVSSLDRMFADLKLDIANRGIQIFHASMAIAKELALNPHVDSIFLQIGSVHDNTARRNEEASLEGIHLFQRYLLRFFPGEHELVVIESAIETGFASRLTTVRIDRLSEAVQAFNYNASAYVPALGM